MAGSRSIGGIFATLSLKDANFRKGLSSASAGLEKFGKASMAAGAAGVAAIGALSVAGMIGFVKSSSEAAATIEDLAIQFEVLTGSSKKSADLLKAFRDEEKKSALSTEDYAKAAQKLLGNRVAYEKILPALKLIGDVSMGSAEKFDRLALAFSQTSGNAKLMGQELNQFIDAGFNPLAQIEIDTGTPMAQLRKDMEKGLISVEMVEKAFINATSKGGLFYKAIEKGSAGTNAKINQTKAAITQLQVAFGTGFNDGLKIALDGISAYLPTLESKFASIGVSLGRNITVAMNLIGSGTWWDLFVLQAELAFAKVLELPVFKQLASLMMSLASADTFLGDPSMSYQESADFLGGQNAKDIEARIDKILKEAMPKAVAKAGEESPLVSPMAIPSMPEIEIPKLNIEIPSMPERNIDDYQRRGLSLSKTPGAVQDKVLKVQEQIRDILKAAKMQGKELVWT